MPKAPKTISLQSQIQSILSRNARVEADKAWETSGARKIVVALLTYIVIVLFFLAGGFPRPWVNALVPTLGFLLSTLTVDLAKSWWLKKVYRSQ